MFYSKSTNGFYDAAIHGADIPDDAVEISVEEHTALLEGQSQGKQIVANANGFPVLQDALPPTAEETAAAKVAAVQSYMDQRARALNYDDIKTACTYADEPAVPKFQAEGRAFRAWRSLVWATCYNILDQVNAGTRPIPDDEALIALLPALELPA